MKEQVILIYESTSAAIVMMVGPCHWVNDRWGPQNKKTKVHLLSSKSQPLKLNQTVFLISWQDPVIAIMAADSDSLIYNSKKSIIFYLIFRIEICFFAKNKKKGFL
jgi:hypothetical protein